MKDIIYLRCSTAEQDLETQRRMCLEKAKSLHMGENIPYKIFEDEDVSSGKEFKKRIELQKMLNSIQEGDNVIVYKLDRLSRDVIEMVTIYRLIVNKYKASIISLNDPYSDEFTVGLMGLIAQQEKTNLKKRITDTLNTKKQKGERISRYLPYGYDLHPTKLVAVKKDKKIEMKLGVLIPNEAEMKIIYQMLALYEGGKSYQKIASTLTDIGYLNREGKPFQKMSIYRILQRINHDKPQDQSLEESEDLMYH